MQIFQVTDEHLKAFLKTYTDELRDSILAEIKEEQTTKLPEYINKNEAAALLGVSRSSIYTHTKNGNLKIYQIGRSKRYKKDEVLNSLIHINKFKR